mgnify:CR=1 FL=1
MKTIVKYIILPGAVLGATALLQSCAMESPFGNGGEGSLSINTEIRGETRLTRADNALANSNPEYYRLLEQKCVVFLENSRGVMRKFKGLDNIPTSINLSAGQYVCNAWTGDSVSASFDSKFYRGQQTFEIAENQNTSLSMKCNIANVVVSVDGASVAETGLKNAKITFSTPRGSLEFDESMFADKKGYFMTPSPETKAADPEKYAKNTTVTVKVEGTTDDGKAYVKESNITDVQRAHEYQVVLTANQQEIQEGGALIQLVIKDIPVIEDTVEIFPAPIVKGYGFDMTEQLVNTDRTFTDQKLYICEYKGTGSVMMEFSENFTGFTGGNLFDNAYVSELTGKGITVERKESQDAESGVDVCEIYVTFPAAFLNGLAPSTTQYVVTITATDSRNLVTTSSLRIANTNEAVDKVDDVISDPAPDTETNPMAVLASKATLTATLYNADAARYGIKYRKAGESDWNEVLATGSTGMPRRTRANVGTPYSVTLTGLEPGTTYEYKAFADEFESAVVQSFTTESKYIFPNASMEEWSTYQAKTLLGKKTVIFPGTGGAPTFWDSGNEGGATANKVLTDKSEDMKHSGTYSARLASASALDMLAAGNLFFGDYVRTDGTNGVLAMGRPYNGSHPAKLRVWMNYRPGVVDIIKKGNEGLVPFAKGDNDHGQIYVALTDEEIEIRTNPDNQKLFSTEDPHVLAYGQMTWTENFGPDGNLEMIEIPLEYYDRARTTKATHIVITCCASKFGDFFSGSSKSVMYLDDFELVYE